MSDEEQKGSVRLALEKALLSASPSCLYIENESINHAGYFPGKETHFKVVIVSDDFIGKTRVARHQMVYHSVRDLLNAHGGSIHALAIHAYTLSQWRELGVAPRSPDCAGLR